jgi:hypothetical protein
MLMIYNYIPESITMEKKDEDSGNTKRIQRDASSI